MIEPFEELKTLKKTQAQVVLGNVFCSSGTVKTMLQRTVKGSSCIGREATFFSGLKMRDAVQETEDKVINGILSVSQTKGYVM